MSNQLAKRAKQFKFASKQFKRQNFKVSYPHRGIEYGMLAYRNNDVLFDVHCLNDEEYYIVNTSYVKNGKVVRDHYQYEDLDGVIKLAAKYLTNDFVNHLE